MTKLWLDDEREPPDDSWAWVKTVDEAIYSLSTEIIHVASLDHDLGIKRSGKEKTGYDVVLWMAEHDKWPRDRVEIHSWNSVGSERMAATVDRYGPYDKRCQRIPARQP